MNRVRSQDENKQIHDLCQDIRSFCFANAVREYMSSWSKNAYNATQKTSIVSEIGILILSMNWEKLFTDERWLVMLEEVALMNYIKKYEPVNDALSTLLKLFPEETEGRINPLYLPK